jgi:diketogulonate reductase-like aldo/keto reductase
VTRTLAVQGLPVPAFFYGTAWKEDRTRDLTGLALRAGFAAIDTANQRKHYFEAAVGDAIAAFLAETGRRREELFVQTKFTYAAGQDHRLPFDPQAPYATQVQQSFAGSLEHLRTSYVDSYVLHGPEGYGLSKGDLEVWRAMESLHQAGQARLLGVSNVDVRQLETLYRGATVKPAFVQNRCFAQYRWDADVRAFCRAQGLVYQGFSLLTANRQVLGHPELTRIAARHGRTPAQVVFRFALQVGMIPLTGTSSPRHMQDDLACVDFELSAEDVQAIERVGRG